MTTTIGTHLNTGREFRICTGHSRGILPTWELLKDHNDIRKGWLRARGRLAEMMKARRVREALQGERRKRHKRNWRLFGKSAVAKLRGVEREKRSFWRGKK